MKQFTSVHDIQNVEALIADGIALKNNPYQYKELGAEKTLGLVFFNSSLRTRLSTQKAAHHLGMQVIVLNVGTDGWALELQDGAVMNGASVEHIKDAAAVMGLYCDIIGVRNFPTLRDRDADYAEDLQKQFIQHCKVPFVSLESATLHPLQSLADMMTIAENATKKKPKIVLTWAPHVKPLPQAVPNSFAEWALRCGHDLTITHPGGYDLKGSFTKGAIIEHDQDKALKNADFVYVKNWSSYDDYGNTIGGHDDWMVNAEKMALTNNAFAMHCLPVRRNVVMTDAVLDSNRSLVLAQATNRVFAAQIVLQKMLESNF